MVQAILEDGVIIIQPEFGRGWFNIKDWCEDALCSRDSVHGSGAALAKFQGQDTLRLKPHHLSERKILGFISHEMVMRLKSLFIFAFSQFQSKCFAAWFFQAIQNPSIPGFTSPKFYDFAKNWINILGTNTLGLILYLLDGNFSNITTGFDF